MKIPFEYKEPAEIPEDLRSSIPIVVKLWSIQYSGYCVMDGYEADDIIGTPCRAGGERWFRYIHDDSW